MADAILVPHPTYWYRCGARLARYMYVKIYGRGPKIQQTQATRTAPAGRLSLSVYAVALGGGGGDVGGVEEATGVLYQRGGGKKTKRGDQSGRWRDSGWERELPPGTLAGAYALARG